MIHILLVEDHSYVRMLLRQLIEMYDDISIVGEAVNGEDALRLAAKLQPDVVIMDVHLPVLSGVVTTTLIKLNNPSTAIIGLTAGSAQEDEKAMLVAGAASVINKSDVLQALHPAIIDAAKQVIKPVIY